MTNLCFVCGKEIKENNVRAFMTHVKCENGVIPILNIQCPFCDLKLDNNEESLAMHIEIGHILPNYIPISVLEAHIKDLEEYAAWDTDPSCNLIIERFKALLPSKEEKEKPKE